MRKLFTSNNLKNFAKVAGTAVSAATAAGLIASTIPTAGGSLPLVVAGLSALDTARRIGGELYDAKSNNPPRSGHSLA